MADRLSNLPVLLLAAIMCLSYAFILLADRQLRGRANGQPPGQIDRIELISLVKKANRLYDLPLILEKHSEHPLPQPRFTTQHQESLILGDNGDAAEDAVHRLYSSYRKRGMASPTAVTGPSGAGKSYCLGRFAEQLREDDQSFFYLQASMLDLSDRAGLLVALARLVSYQYNIGETVATSAIRSGLVAVVLDGVAELGVDDREYLATELNRICTDPMPMFLFIGIRSDIATDIDLRLDRWATVTIQPIERESAEKFAQDVAKIPNPEDSLELSEFRSPLSLHVLAEAEIPSTEASDKPIQLHDAWMSLANRKLQNPATRGDEIRTANWIGSIVRDVIPGSVLELEAISPEWASREYQVSARRKIGAAAAGIALPFCSIFLLALYFTVAQVGLFLVAMSLIYGAYWLKPTLFKRGRRMVLRRRSWSFERLHGDQERRIVAIRTLSGIISGLGSGTATVAFSIFVAPHSGTSWLIGAAAAFFVASVLWPGGLIGLLTGCFGFAVAIGFFSDPVEALVVPLAAGAVAGLIFGIADAGEIVVSSKPGDSRTVARAFARSWGTTVIFETGQWLSFGFAFGLVGSLAGGSWQWMRFGLVGALVGIVIFGVVGGVMPWLDHHFGLRAIEAELELDARLLTTLKQLCRHGLVIEIGSHSFRLFHDSMPDLDLRDHADVG